MTAMRDMVSIACKEYFSTDPGRGSLASNVGCHNFARKCLDYKKEMTFENLDRVWKDMYSRLSCRDHAERLLEIMGVKPFLTFSDFAHDSTTARCYDRSYKPHFSKEQMKHCHTINKILLHAHLGLSGVARTWTKPSHWIAASFMVSELGYDEIWVRLAIAEERLKKEAQRDVIQENLETNRGDDPRPLAERRATYAMTLVERQPSSSDILHFEWSRATSAIMSLPDDCSRLQLREGSRTMLGWVKDMCVEYGIFPSPRHLQKHVDHAVLNYLFLNASSEIKNSGSLRHWVEKSFEHGEGENAKMLAFMWETVMGRTRRES